MRTIPLKRIKFVMLSGNNSTNIRTGITMFKSLFKLQNTIKILITSIKHIKINAL